MRRLRNSHGSSEAGMIARAWLIADAGKGFSICLTAIGWIACGGCGVEQAASEKQSIIHLSDRVSEAVVESAAAPVASQQELTWDFAASGSAWRAVSSDELPFLAAVELVALSDGTRLTLERPEQQRGPLLIGGIAVEIPELRFDQWETVLLRARTSDRFAGVTLAYDVDNAKAVPRPRVFFASSDEAPPLFNDGSVQTYAIPLRAPSVPLASKDREDSEAAETPSAFAAGEGGEAKTTFHSLAVFFAAPATAAIDILSIELVPRGAAFSDSVGNRSVVRRGTTRQTLFAHTPASLGYSVDLLPKSRLDFALTVSPGESVTYRVSTDRGGERSVLFEQTVDDSETWQQYSVDLAAEAEIAGGDVQVILEAESEHDGAIALWGAPILSGQPLETRPNVIFYVIDGGDADLMSLYGYERPTTPYIEQLAKEGVVFTRAFSNATWTQPSTLSFMTSLQHSVLGGLGRGIHSSSLPKAATTMAEHFRRGGYQTVSLTTNPNAGRIIGLDRGLDYMRDVETEHHSTSSLELEDYFWKFREAYPGGPYWVHFQTTDVHEPNQPEEPFAGQFVTAEQRAQLQAWDDRIWKVAGRHFGTTSVIGFYDLALEATKIDRQEYFSIRKGLYDETMTHQDRALERLVNRLKATGEWEHTILVIGSDHGHPAGTFARFGRGLFDPQPEPWQGALFDAYATRVPLLVIYPGKIEAGRSFDEPVSMIDVLPTLLDLVGLPQPEILQGQSLAPLLRGEPQDIRPVILDEFRVDEVTGKMIGNLEIIDGDWGASLEIAPPVEGVEAAFGRHSVPAGGRWGAVHPFFEDVPKLLLYNLKNDPFAKQAVNEANPDLVRHYGKLLLEQWEAHRSLAVQFGETEGTAIAPEQLRQLKALGYIQ
ncbi:MAG: sulfatase [Thermoanaerobaculia bacterium]